jgi:hypothetical protein
MSRELDIKILTAVYGIKESKIHYGEEDTNKEWPEFIPSGKPWRTHQIDARPVPYFSTDASATYNLMLKFTNVFHWLIRSPFSPKYNYWIAGLTPLESTGWNGRSDYEAQGETMMESVCLVVLNYMASSVLAHDIIKPEEQ